MSLYGHTNINIDALKRWTNTLSAEQVSQVDIGGNLIRIDDQIRDVLRLQLQTFADLANQLEDGDDWRNCLYATSHLFYNAFLRINNSSIRIADFYECLVVPSNMKTHKKIIKGFDDIDIGAIHIKNDSGEMIATIGQKSDLIWSVFYEYFINENDDGSINHTYSNHEQYLSIQLFGVEDKSTSELAAIMNEMLLRVSMEYDMDFKVFEVNSMFKQIGNSPIYNMQFVPTGFEQVPTLYLTNAINSTDERLSYLSYYQVIEYFFVRAQNYFFLDELSKIDVGHIDHNELRKVLAGYKRVSNEKTALKLVFSKAIDIAKIKDWLKSKPEYQEIYCNSESLKIDISKSDMKIIEQLVERVYSFRCSIAHAKGDVEEYIAVPLLSKETISNELPLLKYLAFEVISICSET